MSAVSLSEELASWQAKLSLSALPADVVESTRLRILDFVGLVLVGRAFDIGRSILAGGSELGGLPESHVLGQSQSTGAATAALVNGALAEAIEFDDTHNETIIHPTSPVASAAFAAGEMCGASGEQLLVAVAAGIELTCRVGVIAPGRFHPRGLHPTGVIGPFGAAFAASRLMQLDPEKTRMAVGIAGSLSSGILQCFVDGTWAKVIHPGWAAHSGLVAARLARAGFTGPAQVFEGKNGIFRSHLQDPDYKFDFERAARDLGNTWESRQISFKRYPNAAIAAGAFDAVLYLRSTEKLRAEHIKNVTCYVPDYWIPIICEPAAEKLRPATGQQARISLQFGIAEAIYYGRLDATSYTEANMKHPALLDLAAKVHYEVDPKAPGRSQYQGWVVIETVDGRRIERIETHNRGSVHNPTSRDDVEQKFRDNAGQVLPPAKVEALIQALARIESQPDLVEIAKLCQLT